MASRSGRGGRSRGQGRYRNHPKAGEPFSSDGKRDKEQKVDESSPVIKAFRLFQSELDSRNDRYERIVKLSRDITIESKRIIFLLQRCSGSDERDTVLAEAAEKIKELHASKFYSLALELEGQDHFQFLRAFSPGLQEYIEAVTFYHYLLDEHLVCADKIQSSMTFVKKSPESQVVGETPASETQSESEETAQKDQADEACILVQVPLSEYMLGVADFTGELMRMAINSVGAGDLDTPALVTKMMRVIHGAFTTFNNPPRELRQKTRVLSQSLHKVEQACYTLKVRGSELPTHMLADVFSSGRPMSNVEAFANEELDDHYE